jgi:hypothetical protein
MRDRLCKDCKHYRKYEKDKIYPELTRGESFENGCVRTTSPSVNPVTGEYLEVVYQVLQCEQERGWDYTPSPGGCGKEGRFFEPKEKET